MYICTHKLLRALWWEGMRAALIPVTSNLWTTSAHVIEVEFIFTLHRLSFIPFLVYTLNAHPESECGWLFPRSWFMLQHTFRAHLYIQSNEQLKYLGHIQCHSVRHVVHMHTDAASCELQIYIVYAKTCHCCIILFVKTLQHGLLSQKHGYFFQPYICSKHGHNQYVFHSVMKAEY